MSRLERRIRDVVARRLPRGWRLEERSDINYRLEAAAMSSSDGDQVIIVSPLVSRWALYCFLHEVGHVVSGHLDVASDYPVWLKEYEAERWAMDAFRAEGFRVSSEILATSITNVRERIREACAKDPDTHFDEHVLRWAFSETWRDWN